MKYFPVYYRVLPVYPSMALAPTSILLSRFLKPWGYRQMPLCPAVLFSNYGFLIFCVIVEWTEMFRINSYIKFNDTFPVEPSNLVNRGIY